MSNTKVDKAKGKIKEAAGSITGDDKLKREGQVEQVVAEVKETVSNVVDKASDLLRGK